MAKKTETISESIRREIEESGHSAYYLAQQTGLPQPTISRFILGHGARSSTLDRLGEELGLAIVKSKRDSAPKAGAARSAKQAKKSGQTAGKQRRKNTATKRKLPTRSSHQAKTPPRGPQSRGPQ